MRVFAWPRNSLRKRAVRRQRELEGVSTARHIRRRARHWGWKLLHDRRWSLLLALPAFLLAFLPIGVSPEAFRNSSFLEALWQVQAAALALSLAVVIFIFEAVYSARPRPSMRELAEDVRLPAIFYAGLLGLGVTGMALLGVGTDAPGGWAATWAVIWAGLSGAGLIALFVAMLREIEPDLLYRRWLRRLTRQVELVIETEIVERIAANLLKDVCERSGVEFIPVLGDSAAPHLAPVAAGSAGVVSDLDLRRITRVGRLSADLGTASDHHGEHPTLLVYIGARVAEGSTLMRVADEIGRRVRLRRAFDIDRRDPDAALDDALRQVHDEALRAIREGSPGAYVQIAAVYERMLLALPETWARHGQEFGPAIAGGLHPFELTLLDRVERRLYEELAVAVLSPSREIGRHALGLPLEVAFRTADLRAISLARRMLNLFVVVEQALIGSPASENRSALLGNSWLRLSEYGRYAERLITDGRADEVVRHGVEALREVMSTYAQLGKAVLDRAPRETDLLAEVNRYLSEFLVHWTPEHDRPQQWEVDLLIERGGVADDELVQMQARARNNEERARTKRELELWCAAQRLGLLWWSLRRLRQTGDSAYIDAWNTFAGYFSDVGEAARVLDHAIEADYKERTLWSSWVMGELPVGQVHSLAVDNELLETFVVVALNRISSDGPAPIIPPLQWIASRPEDVRSVIDRVQTDEVLQPVLPNELPQRVERLTEAVHDMRRAYERQEEQRVIDATVDTGVLDEFQRTVRDTWGGRRLLAPMLQSVGMYQLEEGRAEDDTRWGFGRELIPKDMFIDERRVLGAEWRAEEMGRELAHSEIKRYLAAVYESQPLVAGAGVSVSEMLRRAIAEVRIADEDVVAFVPPGWRLSQALELAPANRLGGSEAPPAWLPEGVRDSFLGTADRAPVFDVVQAQLDGIAVVALTRYARCRQWLVEGAHEVGVSLAGFDEEDARALVRENEALYRTDVRTSIEERARKVRRSLLLEVYEQLVIDVIEGDAARWFRVPDELV